MVYKRYIKKDGKFYGPYEYKSVKQDGKVISEYVGKGVKKELKRKIICSKNCFYAIIILLSILILLQVFVVDLILTGKATLTTEKTYLPGEQITGSVKLNLVQGELIPADAKVVIDNSGDIHEYLLSDFLGDETSEGNFYISGKEISGNGVGYGIKGQRIIYPEVNFVLKIADGSPVESSGEIITENESEQITEENESIENSEIIDEEITENDGETEEITEDNNEVIEEVSESSEENPAITGAVIDENSDLIEGSVSKDFPFIYVLSEGKSAEIVSSEHDINVKVKEEILTVTTDYSETEEGYGEEYAGREEISYNINLDELNITAKEGKFLIKVVYGDEDLVSVERKINIDYGENETLEEVTGLNATNETIVTNITNETIVVGNSSLKIDTTQYGAVVGMPVKWKKKISAENTSNITVELPKEAENVSVFAVQSNISVEEIADISEEVSITGMASAEISLGEKSSIISFFKKIFNKVRGAITGKAIDVQQEEDSVTVNIDNINESNAEYEIEYETPAPVSIEQNISNGKRIVISSDVHYENILAYSELPYETQLNKIRLYYYDDITGIKKLSTFDAYDADGNLIIGNTPEQKGYENVSVADLINDSEIINSIPEQNLVSFITWVVPHLSNQTYEIIIEITNAEHLDSNRTLIENIYETVKAQDGIWSPVINNNEYVRVTFSENLTNINDITVYARSLDNETASIEIYSENRNTTISIIDGISLGLYKTYLTNLNESIGVFDLKIIGNIEFDYIVDPYSLNLTLNGTGNNITVEPEDIAHLNISDGSLVLYMPFDVQHSSANKTYDYTNNSNDGTLTNGPTFNSTGGYNGSGAYTFDGSNDYILVGDSNSLDMGTSNYSIVGWVRLDNRTTLKSFGRHGGGYSTGAPGWTIYFNNGNPYLQFSSSSAVYSNAVVPSATQLSSGIWYHVSGVFDRNGNFTWYLNGVINGNPVNISSSSGISIAPSLNLFIGSDTGGGSFLNGSIDEVMIFNKSLSVAEVQQIYNSSYSRFYPTGELLFQNLNLGTKDKVNLTLNSCSQNNGSYLQGKINDGDYQNFSGCSLGDYLIPGDKTSANLTVKFVASSGNFYSPLVVGNVSLTEFRNDTTAPSVVINSPANNSYINSVARFDALVSDNSGTTYAFINDTNLVGYWTFDTTNSTGVFDTSGKNNFGIFNGGLGTSNLSTAKFGQGLQFDGSDDYVLVSDFDDLSFYKNWTISLYVKFNDVTTEQNILTSGTSISDAVAINVKSSSIRCAVYNSTFFGPRSVAVSANNWYHVIYMWDSSSQISTAYLNSINMTGGSVVAHPTGAYGVINLGSQVAGSYPFNGSIDELTVFNRTLSSDEVKALYNSSAQKFNVSYSLPSSGVNNLQLVAVDTASNTNITSLVLNNDPTYPTITFENPTPSNSSYVNSATQTIVANVSDSSNQNGSAFVDFDRSLVGYWSMDSSNSTGIYDNSSYGNFGTFNGGLGTNNLTTGARGNGLSFDGTDDSVNLVNVFNLSNISVSAWAYPNKIELNTGSYAMIFSGGSSPNRFYLDAYSNTLRFHIGNLNLNSPAMNGRWYLMTAVYSPNTRNASLYVNGNYVNSILIDSTIPSSFRIGSFVGGGFPFNGSIDEVLIFNRTLSQSEISALYNSQANKFNATFTNLATGQHNYTLYGVDSAGNVNTSIRNFVLDTEKPVIEFVSPTENSGVTITKNYTYINTTITDNYNSDKSAWIDWNKSLVGYWSMDYYNSTGIYDNSSYGNFGIFNGGLQTGNISQGARGNGLSFDGSNDYLQSVSTLGIVGNFTLSAWVNPINIAGYHRIISAQSNDYSLLLNGNKLSYQILNSGHANVSSSSINSNVWTHVLVAFDSSTGNIQFYINGTKDINEYIDMRLPLGNPALINIGKASADAQYFNGSIDEVLIFNRSLSATEISALYNNSAYRYENNFTNLADRTTYNYSVYAMDAAGNLNITGSRNLSVNLDSNAPQVSVVLPVEGNTYTSSSVTFQIATDENSTCNYSIDSFATNNSMTSTSNGTIHEASATISANGNYAVNYSCADSRLNINSTKGANFAISISSGETGGTGGSGDSGGGGGGGAPAVSEGVNVNVDSIERTLALNKIEFGQINVENTGENSRTFSVSVLTINSLLEFEETSLEISPGESKDFEFRITPPSETGIYTGKIIIISGSFRKEIPIILNIKTEKSLYDLIVTISKSMKIVEPSTNLVAQIDLLQMGIKEKMDVTLNYVIKDFDGKVHFSESETIAVENQKTLEKELHTSDLDEGDYVLGVELIYPDGVAVASSQFKIGKEGAISKINYLEFIIIAIIVLILAGIFIIIRRYRKIVKSVKKK